MWISLWATTLHFNIYIVCCLTSFFCHQLSSPFGHITGLRNPQNQWNVLCKSQFCVFRTKEQLHAMALLCYRTSPTAYAHILEPQELQERWVYRGWATGQRHMGDWCPAHSRASTGKDVARSRLLIPEQFVQLSPSRHLLLAYLGSTQATDNFDRPYLSPGSLDHPFSTWQPFSCRDTSSKHSTWEQSIIETCNRLASFLTTAYSLHIPEQTWEKGLPALIDHTSWSLMFGRVVLVGQQWSIYHFHKQDCIIAPTDHRRELRSLREP